MPDGAEKPKKEIPVMPETFVQMSMDELSALEREFYKYYEEVSRGDNPDNSVIKENSETVLSQWKRVAREVIERGKREIEFADYANDERIYEEFLLQKKFIRHITGLDVVDNKIELFGLLRAAKKIVGEVKREKIEGVNDYTKTSSFSDITRLFLLEYYEVDTDNMEGLFSGATKEEIKVWFKSERKRRFPLL